MHEKEHKIKLCEALTRPFSICGEYRTRTGLWFMYVILGGLLGVFINLINRWICGDMGFEEAMYMESVGGTFYTYAIVLIAAAIGPLFFSISESKILHFREIKAFTISICFFVIVFGAVFYSNLDSDVIIGDNQGTKLTYSLDWGQLIFFVLAIVLALYPLGIEYLDKDPDHHKDIDSNGDYMVKEQKQVEKLEDANPTETGNGVAL